MNLFMKLSKDEISNIIQTAEKFKIKMRKNFKELFSEFSALNFGDAMNIEREVINKEEEEYIEWETLISLKENFEYSIEYIVHSKNKEETRRCEKS